MLSPKYIELFERLSERTDKGEAQWEETASDKVFITFFQGFSLSLGMWLGFYDSETVINVALRDEQGKIVDDFGVRTDDPNWNMLEKLFTKIYEKQSSTSRKAREVDAAVDTVLNQLRLAS